MPDIWSVRFSASPANRYACLSRKFSKLSGLLDGNVQEVSYELFAHSDYFDISLL